MFEHIIESDLEKFIKRLNEFEKKGYTFIWETYRTTAFKDCIVCGRPSHSLIVYRNQNQTQTQIEEHRLGFGRKDGEK